MIRYVTFVSAALLACIVELVALMQGNEVATYMAGAVGLYWTFKAAGEIHEVYSSEKS